MKKLKIPADIPKNKMQLAKEMHRLHESCLYSSQGQFELGKQWRLNNILLGVPASILAALAGSVGLAQDDKTLLPPILALLSAGFGAALTTLNPSRRSELAQIAGNSYLEIQTAARQYILVDLKDMDNTKARQKLDELTTKRNKINKTADPPNRLARFMAKRIIDGGGQDYSIDEK